MDTSSGIMTFLAIAAFFIAVLWILMPFAVFGLKDLTRDAIAQQRKTNQLLEQMIAQRNKE